MSLRSIMRPTGFQWLAAALFAFMLMFGASRSAQAETVYGVTLIAPDGTTTNIEIHRSLNPLPGSDTWVALTSDDLGYKGGPVSSWGQQSAFLTGPAGAQSIILDGFTAGASLGDTGSGAKNFDDGTFPMGSLTWKCISKS